MSARFNGWQRIGIVLSVIWAAGAAYYDSQAMSDRLDAFIKMSVNTPYGICRDAQDRAIGAGNPFQRDCVAESHRNLQKALSDFRSFNSRWEIAIAAFVPIPIGWLVVYGLIALMRWIRRGFKQPT